MTDFELSTRSQCMGAGEGLAMGTVSPGELVGPRSSSRLGPSKLTVPASASHPAPAAASQQQKEAGPWGTEPAGHFRLVIC